MDVQRAEPPNVYVFTGSSKLDKAPGGHGRGATYVRSVVRQLQSQLVPHTYFITGAQVGVDLVALAECLRLYPWAHHSVWVPAKRCADVKPLVESNWPRLRAAGGSYQLHYCMPGTDYRYRNLCMLQEAYDMVRLGSRAEVLAFPLYQEADARAKYSGTWLCKRQATAAKLPCSIWPLWELGK